MNNRREIIPINQLVLSDDNPRLDIYDDTQDLLREMIDDQQDQIFILAEDILNFGISPLDLWAVYPALDGKYKVAEGNRRLSATILLNKPELIKPINPRIYSRFVELLASSGKTPPTDIECVIFKSFDDPNLQHWIQLRHLGLNKGKGIATWDSVQKARYKKKLFGVNALIDFWETLVEMNILTLDQIQLVSKTNWERILNKKGRDYLGLGKTEEAYHIPKDRETMHRFEERIKKIVEKLSGQTVAIVYDNEKISDFLDMIHIDLYGIPINDQQTKLFWDDNPNREVSKDIKGATAEDDNSQEVSVPKEGDNSGTDTTRFTTKDFFNNCKTIIPNGYAIRSSNHRINSIIKELKKLDVDIYPNACGMLLRLLFELSAKHYLERNSGGLSLEQMKFEQLLKESREMLATKKKISNSQKAQLKSDQPILNHLFNGYAHNTDTYPSTEALKGYFKAHQTFIIACLET